MEMRSGWSKRNRALYFEVRPGNGLDATFGQYRNPFRLIVAFVATVVSTRRFERTGYWTRQGVRRAKRLR